MGYFFIYVFTAYAEKQITMKSGSMTIVLTQMKQKKKKNQMEEM